MVRLRRLTAPSGPELDQAIETLHDAFKDHPMDLAFNGYDESLIEPEWRSNLLAALAPNSGEVWIASLQEGDMDAICISYGPGTWYLKNESEQKMRDEMFNNKLSDKAKKWFEQDFHRNLDILYQRCLGENFEERTHAAWQVAMLGTRTDKQGHGLGTALMRVILEKADAAGVEVILETNTADHLRFYERLGFVNAGEPVYIPIEGGECGFWCMTRAPNQQLEA